MNEIYNQSSYSISEIKSVIQNHLYTSSGKLNAAITRRDWFKSSTFYNEVIRLTESHDITFAGRLVLILNDFPICPHCNIRPLSYYNRILETCNDPECIAKVINEKRLKTMREKYGANVSPLTIEQLHQLSINRSKFKRTKQFSIKQLQLYHKIKQLAPDAILNDRIQLNGKELDILIKTIGFSLFEKERVIIFL